MNDKELIWERYKLICEMPASLEFASDTLKNHLDPKITPVNKTTKNFKARQADINVWKNPKHHTRMKEVAKATAKGLDRKRAEEGKPSITWRLIDVNLEKEDFLYSKYDLLNLFKDNPNLYNSLKVPNSITVFMNPTGLDDKKDIMAFSSWIRSHKCGHAILSYDKNSNIDKEIKTILERYYKLYMDCLKECANSQNKEQEYTEKYPIFTNTVKDAIGKGYNVWKTYIDHYNNKTNFFNDFCTFGSARNKKLREQDINEEFVAQLMQTGKIKVNKMLDDNLIKRSFEYYPDRIEEIESSYNKILNIESFISNIIEQAIDNCVGEVLYDLN